MGDSSSRHKLDWVPVDDIIPNEWNANEQDDKTFDALVDDVADTGFIETITVVPLDTGKYRIIGGEHRWRAAKATGEEELPCLILQGAKWEEEDLQKFVTVRMNLIKGKLSPTKFAPLYQEMAEKYGKEQLQKLFGFVDKKAFNHLVQKVVGNAKKALPPEFHKEIEERAKESKTAEDLGVVVQEMFAKYGDTMSQNYMIMTHGGQEHIYIRMNTSMRKAMDKAMTYCDVTKTDINEFMEPIVKAFLDEAVAKLEEVESSENASSNNNPF